MNIQRFLCLLGEVIVTHAITADEELKSEYLEWARKTWPRLANLEELLDALSRQKFYRQTIETNVKASLQAAVPRSTDVPHLLEQPAVAYFQIVHGEPYGFTSSVIGELQKNVVPRLIAKAKVLRDISDESLWDCVTECLGDEFAGIVGDILKFRVHNSDNVSTHLFSEE